MRPPGRRTVTTPLTGTTLTALPVTGRGSSAARGRTAIVNVLGLLKPTLPAPSACRARAVYVPGDSAGPSIDQLAPERAADSVCSGDPDVPLPPKTSTVTVPESPTAAPAPPL